MATGFGSFLNIKVTKSQGSQGCFIHQKVHQISFLARILTSGDEVMPRKQPALSFAMHLMCWD